jgi:serine/threonine-protein kinase RsbW
METRKFPGRFDSLENISQFVVGAAKAAGLDARAVYAVELAVDEACSNIIEHSYGGEGRGELSCSVDAQHGEITIIIQDSGKPFQPEDIPKPVFNVPIEKLKPRGVGFFLMQKMMDEIRYESIPNQLNTLTMIKRGLQLNSGRAGLPTS